MEVKSDDECIFHFSCSFTFFLSPLPHFPLFVLAYFTRVFSPFLLGFLVRWCEVRRPGRLVDLGSGITSWTLRSWRDRYSPDSRVISVDDNPDWLARSRAYSRAAGTGDEDFLLWDEFLQQHGSDRFDLVVHDFGSVRERARQMSTAFDLVGPGGAIICDDIHKARIWRAARNSMWRRGWTGWSLREETLDSIGRFSLLVVRPLERI